jgi:Xaa-Pro aminopeptidase
VTRIERLAALLQEPLLVAGPPYVLGGQANVRYLTGLQSSNAAVLVEPDASATLYADFRYAARGREIEGISFVETARGLVPAIGELLAGRRVAFEEAHLPFSGYRALVDAGVDAIPSSGVVESLRAVKDDEEIAIMRRAGAVSDGTFDALSKQRFTGRAPSASSCGGSSAAFARPGRTASRSRPWSQRARRRRRRTPSRVTG